MSQHVLAAGLPGRFPTVVVWYNTTQDDLPPGLQSRPVKSQPDVCPRDVRPVQRGSGYRASVGPVLDCVSRHYGRHPTVSSLPQTSALPASLSDGEASIQ